MDGDFQPLSAAELLTQDVEELKRSVADKKEEADREKERAGRVRPAWGCLPALNGIALLRADSMQEEGCLLAAPQAGRYAGAIWHSHHLHLQAAVLSIL